MDKEAVSDSYRAVKDFLAALSAFNLGDEYLCSMSVDRAHYNVKVHFTNREDIPSLSIGSQHFPSFGIRASLSSYFNAFTWDTTEKVLKVAFEGKSLTFSPSAQ